MKLLVLVQTDLFLVWWHCTVQKDEILVGESIGDEESVGIHVIFFLSSLGVSLFLYSLSVPLLNGCMTAKKVILGKFSPPFQQELPFLRWPAPACLGPHSPISLPFFVFFSIFSLFFNTHSFSSLSVCTSYSIPPTIPIYISIYLFYSVLAISSSLASKTHSLFS